MTRHLRRARAAAQLLGEPQAVDALDHLVGVQAQDLTAAALALRVRGHSMPADAVITWTMRGTRHLHHAADVPWLIATLGPAFNRPGRRAEQLGIAGRKGAHAVAVLRDALGHGSLTRSEVKDLLAPHGVDPSGQAPIHLIRRAALEGVLYVIPGKPERYALLGNDAAPGADGLAELARRYAIGHGPVTAADFAAWSGLRRSEVDKAEPADSGPIPVRLLGAFDPFLLGYADRTFCLAPQHAKEVNAGGGMIRPTVLADGEVVGTWKRGRGQLDVTLFRSLSKRESRELDAEIADIERVLL